MFDFGNANDGQRQAISTTEGPVLITAGPGTGKTYTLVQRAIYLIEERGVKPEDIFIATFTEKAAKELITRITNELASRNITVNVNEMYVGTFHSLCLRIIKDHLEYTRLKKNYRLLDTFDQQYLVFRNIYKFRTISGIENVMPKGGAWKWAQAICEFSNNLTEEVVDIDAMLSDHDMEISVIAKVVNTYQAMLDEENLMDFSAIQTECYRLLKENKDILEDLRNSIKYIMVDEYQDTNYIQEQTIFLLGTHENICVVGDDDQGLYRFRGATIRNILEFPSKFDVGKCQIIPLVINYRSDSDIVEFYNKWMITTSGSKFKFEWDKFRYDKRIVANETSKIESPCVVKLASKDDEDEWHERVLDFINRLKNSGKIQDYNQLAFLFSSVKHERVISLARFLESNHINVYSPRSDMFFRREEVMQALGCMMLMFPNYVKGLENGEYKFLDNTHYFYFRDCIKAANEFVTKPENLELKRFIRAHGKGHATLAANSSGTTDYTYSGLLYRLFMYKPFSDILDTDIGVGVVDIRPARNLAKLTQIIGKFEYLHNIDVLTGKYIIKNTELLFNMYIKLLFDGGIAEYEDDEEYAPKDADPIGFDNVKNEEFLKKSITMFWERYGGKTYEGLPPKMAIFAASVAEATDVVRPAVEKILSELNVSLDTILVNTGDTTVTKNDDIRDFNNLDVLGTEGSRKQFIILVEKGREGWNCRSLLGIALFRSPKSKIFVLQATMRCLRKLTDEQLKATVFLSKENLDTLDEELRNNYNMEIKDLGQSSDKKKNSYKVRVLPPPRSIKMKRIWHEYSLIEKEYSEPIDFKVSEIDDAKYESKMYEKGSIRLELSTKETVIDDIKDQMRYSRFSLVGEISRYMNLSCVLISRILSEAIDGFDNLVEVVNKHNEVLDDVIIPKIFNTLYEVKSEQKNEDVDVILLKEPKDSGYYEFSADENLVIEKDHNSFTPEEIKKSFHADTYCFDSKPEKECFLQYISSKKVKEIYFTGMFTANQGDLFVQYYDPESKRIRQYYPDFLAKMNDGSYQLIEVKGDNMIDDEVVKAKAEAAEEMSVASGMKYVMYAGSVLMKQNVLEHPPVTYSEEPSPLLMVAEDPVPYGK